MSDYIKREIFLEECYDKDRFNFLDKYFQNHNSDYFIDVERYEITVLKGSINTLKNNKILIQIDANL